MTLDPISMGEYTDPTSIATTGLGNAMPQAALVGLGLAGTATAAGMGFNIWDPWRRGTNYILNGVGPNGSAHYLKGGADDGHLGFVKTLTTIGKGISEFFTGIVKNLPKIAIVTAATVAASCIPVIGPFVMPAVLAYGLATTGAGLFDSISAYCSATSDAEAEEALKSITKNGIGFGLSAFGARGIVKNSCKALHSKGKLYDSKGNHVQTQFTSEGFVGNCKSLFNSGLQEGKNLFSLNPKSAWGQLTAKSPKLVSLKQAQNTAQTKVNNATQLADDAIALAKGDVRIIEAIQKGDIAQIGSTIDDIAFFRNMPMNTSRQVGPYTITKVPNSSASAHYLYQVTPTNNPNNIVRLFIKKDGTWSLTNNSPLKKIDSTIITPQTKQSLNDAVTKAETSKFTQLYGQNGTARIPEANSLMGELNTAKQAYKKQLYDEKGLYTFDDLGITYKSTLLPAAISERTSGQMQEEYIRNQFEMQKINQYQMMNPFAMGGMGMMDPMMNPMMLGDPLAPSIC